MCFSWRIYLSFPHIVPQLFTVSSVGCKQTRLCDVNKASYNGLSLSFVLLCALENKIPDPDLITVI